MKMTLSDAANWAQILGLPLAVVLWFFTRERAVKFWEKWIKLILGALAVLTLITLWRVGWLDWLANSVTWPVWALILLAFSIPAVALLVLWICSLLEAQPAVPDWQDYVSDNVFDVDWHWRYVAGKLDEFEFSPFCPNRACMCRLQPESRGYAIAQAVSLVCPHCGYRRNFDFDWDRLRHNVVFEVERRLRTGEYKQRLAANV
jgi:hypothetical protein